MNYIVHTFDMLPLEGQPLIGANGRLVGGVIVTPLDVIDVERGASIRFRVRD